MTAKKKLLDSDEKPLLSSNQVAVPPSQQKNEEFDSKEDEEWILYSPELDLALEEAVLLGALRTLNAHDRPNKIFGTGTSINSAISLSTSSTGRRVFVENLPTLSISPCPEVITLCSSTVTSSTSSSCLSSYSRRVRFAENLVTEVRLRPKTPPDEQGTLFYTVDEIQRFRQDYRLERSLADDHDVSSCLDPSEGNCLMLSESEISSILGNTLSLKKKQLNKYGISRAVVVHNNVLETYMDGVIHAHSAERSKMHEDDSCFFDKDSFWSGSITWY